VTPKTYKRLYMRLGSRNMRLFSRLSPLDLPKSSIDKHLRTWHRKLQYNALGSVEIRTTPR